MASNSAYHVEFRPAKPDPGKGDQVYRYDVRLIDMGDKLFSMPSLLRRWKVRLRWFRRLPGLVAGHIIGRIWVHPDYLRIALLDPRWMRDNSPDSFRELKGDGTIITVSTQELRDFLLRNSDNKEAMGLNLYLCRPGADCAARAFRWQLSRHPKDSDLLKQVGQFFLARGNYDRALALERLRFGVQA